MSRTPGRRRRPGCASPKLCSRITTPSASASPAPVRSNGVRPMRRMPGCAAPMPVSRTTSSVTGSASCGARGRFRPARPTAPRPTPTRASKSRCAIANRSTKSGRRPRGWNSAWATARSAPTSPIAKPRRPIRAATNCCSARACAPPSPTISPTPICRAIRCSPAASTSRPAPMRSARTPIARTRPRTTS